MTVARSMSAHHRSPPAGGARAVGRARTWPRGPDWPRVLAVVSSVSLVVVPVAPGASAIDVALLVLAARAAALTRAGGRR